MKGYFDLVCSAVARACAVIAHCHRRAPPAIRSRSTAGTSSGSGGSQHNRRTKSGARRFCTGSRCCSAILVRAVRAAVSRIAAAGSRSGQRFTGGGLSAWARTGGRSLGDKALAVCSAFSQVLTCRRCERPLNTGRDSSAASSGESASAASMIAESGSTRPGAMSRCRANRSRACHSSRTAATSRGF